MAKQRLDKILSNMGYCSRREATKIAKSGRILLNGKAIYDLSQKVDAQIDEISFCGETIQYNKHTYILMNKKAGYITATEDKHQKTVLDLLPEKEQKIGLFAAGRLDKDTEGLILLTNDGDLSHSIMSPKNHIKKVYYAEITGELLPDTQERFKEGIVLGDGYKCMSSEIEFLHQDDKIKANITICEGKFHQVKRMVAACGGEITYLKRMSVGTLKLPENLEIGDFIRLGDDEILKLRSLLRKNQ